MKPLRYQLSFQTPAFLGNATQQAQWRTPPIKALLRQWWRVAVAPSVQYNVDRLREREHALFGVAADGDQSRQSQIRLRLSHWNEGKLKDWPRHGTVKHPEVTALVGSDLYLGFGPLVYDRDRRGTAIKANAAIQAGDCATLSLAVPDADVATIGTALTLMNLYGTLGGRSRNGWGSFSLAAADEFTAALPHEVDNTLINTWQDALRLDWPHTIGRDSRGPLIWQTRPFADWPQLMQEMARLKIDLRTQSKFKFPQARTDGQIHDRHWLSYPVTTHKVWDWDKNNARLPNSLRFKVRPAPGDSHKVVGVLVHIPCQPPPAFRPEPQALQRVWKQVHAFLDDRTQQLDDSTPQLTRIPA